MTGHIFISYSKQDIPFARHVKRLIEAEGLRVWMDEEQIVPSQRWWKTIEENIDSCAALLVIMSPAAAESDWVERELLRAEKMRRPVFPVLLAGESWSRLANVQYADMQAGLRAAALPPFLRARLRALVPAPTQPTVRLVVRDEDVFTVQADVLLLKYAQGFHGVDRRIADMLRMFTPDAVTTFSPPRAGETAFVDARQVLGTPEILFVGTTRLRQLDYVGINLMMQQGLAALRRDRPDTTHLALTLHGVNMGLDESEVVRAQVNGLLDALTTGGYPPALQQITLVELNEARVVRIREVIDALIDSGADEALRRADDGGYLLAAALPDPAANAAPPVAAAPSVTVKPHAYVALPAGDATMEDVFYYGVQGAVHAAGLLCVRVEGTLDTPDVLDQILRRIDEARLVVVELSEADAAQRFLWGYALGRGCPVVALTRTSAPLPFDTGRTCAARIVYTSIKQLENALSATLSQLDMNS